MNLTPAYPIKTERRLLRPLVDSDFGAVLDTELALAYLRIAGIHVFQLDYGRCGVAAEQAAMIAEQAEAEFERIWALRPGSTRPTV